MDEPLPHRVRFLGAGRTADATILATTFAPRVASNEKEIIEERFLNALNENKHQRGESFLHNKIDIPGVGGCLYLLKTISATPLVFAVATSDSEYPTALAERCLGEVQQKLQATHGDALNFVAAHALSKALKKKWREQMREYDDVGAQDKTVEVRHQIDGVREQMATNMRHMLDNQQTLEDMSVRAESLNKNSNQFLQQSNELRSAIQMRNRKMMCLLVVVVVALILYLFGPLIFPAAKALAGGDGSSS